MGTYAVTGSASGMGYQAAEQLRVRGHTVIGVDLRDADVIADLSTADGRRAAATRVLELADGKLDGAVLAAGIGPGAGADRARLIAQINYLGTVDLLTAWRPALAAAGNAKVVALGSNSSTTVPAVPRRAIKALLAGDADRAARAVRFFGGGASALMYAASKIAVARWVRQTAVTADWAGRGIRLNVLAPGAIMTPLLQAQLDSPREGKAVRAFPIPTGSFGDPVHLANWITFMLSDSADFLCGSVIFVDGGTDAYFRPDGWPKGVPLRGIPRYVWRHRRFARTR
ncbi:MAG: SDR family oxidoreductase [Mycolicibacterium sp.]|uniref:SDR family oxidoreductase n=1 Tax=Mycolicibacterium sp. TaxID=2320850 RepID=UPI000FB8131C|nr:SDR family oxidoreductase [Mycolicibacterium sp.]RUP32933.1 MAG: SDR family oxidoreductase [Mycolicibacterium sp.]TXH21082.1 MAG: SDR family oxidoreductase [Mycobacterium sp.]